MEMFILGWIVLLIGFYFYKNGRDERIKKKTDAMEIIRQRLEALDASDEAKKNIYLYALESIPNMPNDLMEKDVETIASGIWIFAVNAHRSGIPHITRPES